MGTIAMLAIGILQGRLGLTEIKQAIVDSALTSAMIFIILLGAEIFDAFLALSRLPSMAAEHGSRAWQPSWRPVPAYRHAASSPF